MKTRIHINKKKKKWISFSLLSIQVIFVLLFLDACNKEDTNPDSGKGKIEREAFTAEFSASIGPAGGIIRMNEGILTGMTIEIPSGGLRKNTSFTISSAVIKSHSFGADFNPITPLIRIDNGGDYADSVITITIPCTVPPDHFAMGFYYDDETGQLEGIPVVAINNENVILATRHFSGNHLNEAGEKTKLHSRSRIWSDILVASVQTSKLFEVQESGFRPGIDDWEFPNYGSYLAEGGHCTGQAITAMWYYGIQKIQNGRPALFNRFSTLPGMWEENRNGYRFASVVHKDQNTARRNAWMNKFNRVGTKRFSHDSLHFLSFAYAIHLTKKPQLIEIWDNNNSGHAMIVYKTTYNLLSIADPNFPGNYSRIITLGQNGFIPYESKSNANDTTPVIYNEITYVAKSALFSFELIGQRFSEMQTKTIGDIAPNAFPGVSLQWFDGTSWIEAPDTIHTSLDSIVFVAQCNSCPLSYPGNLTPIQLLDLNGKQVSWSDGRGYLNLKLNAFETIFPIVIHGFPQGNFNSPEYIDFKMPLVIKEKTSQFSYWLKGFDSKGLPAGHFGSKDGKPVTGGKWIGNTFDLYYEFTKNGVRGVYKMNLQCNSTKDKINSYKVEYYALNGNEKSYLISLDGVNLAQSSTNGDYLIYSSYGNGPCASLTRVDFTFWGGISSWGCDEESFIYFSIPKP